jgi:hypothetical protein
MAGNSKWDLPDPVANLDETGPLVLGPGAKKPDSSNAFLVSHFI